MTTLRFIITPLEVKIRCPWSELLSVINEKDMYISIKLSKMNCMRNLLCCPNRRISSLKICIKPCSGNWMRNPSTLDRQSESEWYNIYKFKRLTLKKTDDFFTLKKTQFVKNVALLFCQKQFVGNLHFIHINFPWWIFNVSLLSGGKDNNSNGVSEVRHFSLL